MFVTKVRGLQTHVGYWLGWRGRGKVGKRKVSTFFPVSLGEGGWVGVKKVCCSVFPDYISVKGWRWSFDVALGTLMGRRASWECCLSGYDYAKLLALLYQRWEVTSKAYWLAMTISYTDLGAAVEFGLSVLNLLFFSTFGEVLDAFCWIRGARCLLCASGYVSPCTGISNGGGPVILQGQTTCLFEIPWSQGSRATV